jgi:hypothetical protein
MSSGLIEVTGEVTRSTELKVALGTPILGIRLWVLHDHFAERWGRRIKGRGRLWGWARKNNMEGKRGKWEVDLISTAKTRMRATETK